MTKYEQFLLGSFNFRNEMQIEWTAAAARVNGFGA